MLGHGLAILGIIAGVVLCVNGRGGRRAAGIFAVVLSIAVTLAGAYFFPLPAGRANPDPQPKQNLQQPEKAPAEEAPTPGKE